jgi:hypothetical protein
VPVATFHPDVEPVADLHCFSDALSEDDPDVAYCLALEVQAMLDIQAWGPAYRAALQLVSSLALLSRAAKGRIYFCEAAPAAGSGRG